VTRDTRADAAVGAALDVARGLEVAARAIVERWRSGRHTAVRAGEADEFYEFRRASPGDPASRVDWRASARREAPVIRVRRRQASMTVAVVVDASASMGFRALEPMRDTRSKLDEARVLAAAVVAAALGQGYRVGLVTGDPLSAPILVGRSGLASACAALARLTPAGDAALSASLGEPLGGVSAADLVVAIGDALEPPERLAAAVSAAARRRGGPRDMVLIRVVAPDEIAPPRVDGVLVDPESGGRAVVRDPASVAEILAAHGRAVRRVFSGPGRSSAVHVVGEDPAQTLRRALGARR